MTFGPAPKEPSARERMANAMSNKISKDMVCIACGRASTVAKLEMRRLGNGEVHPLCINPVECRIQGNWPPMSA